MRRGSMIACLAPLVGACGLVLDLDAETDGFPSRSDAGVSDGASQSDASSSVDGGARTDGAAPDGATVGVSGARIAAGHTHTCAVREGNVWCWGRDYNGEVGNGADTPFASPVPTATVPFGAPAVVDLGAFASYAIGEDGSVWSWGSNVQSQLGDRTTVQRTAPGPVSVPAMRSLSGGYFHACGAERVGSRVLCWGRIDNTGAWEDPTEIAGLPDAAVLAAGSQFSCALAPDGQARCWGDNDLGQLGDGTTTRTLDPVAVVGVTDAIAITAGSVHACALDGAGRVACWGGNAVHQLGSETTEDVSTAVDVDIPIATSIDAGEGHTCAVVDTGAVWCWGLNASGQLGNGAPAMTGPPAPVMGLDDAVAVAGGGEHTCALRVTGAIVCWGDNRNGQIGDGTTESPRTTPTEVVFP